MYVSAILFLRKEVELAITVLEDGGEAFLIKFGVAATPQPCYLRFTHFISGTSGFVRYFGAKYDDNFIVFENIRAMRCPQAIFVKFFVYRDNQSRPAQSKGRPRRAALTGIFAQDQFAVPFGCGGNAALVVTPRIRSRAACNALSSFG